MSKQKLESFVIYASDDEVLVTTAKLEKQMRKEWFDTAYGRRMEAFTRFSCLDTAVAIETRFTFGNAQMDNDE